MAVAMEQLWEVLLQVADLARTQDQDQQAGALAALAGIVRKAAEELREPSEDAFETLWTGASGQGLSLQSLTGFVVLMTCASLRYFCHKGEQPEQGSHLNFNFSCVPPLQTCS